MLSGLILVGVIILFGMYSLSFSYYLKRNILWIFLGEAAFCFIIACTFFAYNRILGSRTNGRIVNSEYIKAFFLLFIFFIILYLKYSFFRSLLPLIRYIILIIQIILSIIIIRQGVFLPKSLTKSCPLSITDLPKADREEKLE